MAEQKRKRGGQPKITPDIVRRMEEAASVKSSIAALCFHSGISKDTYYRWIKQDKHLSDRLDALREKPGLNARIVIQKAIAAGDGNLALKYLERTEKAEFAPQTNTQHSGDVTLKNLLTEDGIAE